MFNLKRALSVISQNTNPNWDSIKPALADICWNNRKDLAPGFNGKELFNLGVERGYIKQYPDGSFNIDTDCQSK